MECPICYDVITENTNTVITECGHKFHTNCLMTNIAHNGFGCPCCRSTMAEVPKDEDEDEDDEEDEVEEEEEEEDMTPKPSVELITRKLKDQGITMEQLVKTLLLQHEEYDREEEEYETLEDELFGKIRIIISNYSEVEEIVPTTTTTTTTKPTPTIAKPQVEKVEQIVLDRFYEDRFLRVV